MVAVDVEHVLKVAAAENEDAVEAVDAECSHPALGVSLLAHARYDAHAPSTFSSLMCPARRDGVAGLADLEAAASERGRR